jgi:hypothetical protein
MNLNGILIGSQDPQRLTAYYTRLFGEPGWAGGDFRGWQLGTGYVTVGPHDQVQGRNPQPGEAPEGWIAHLLGSGRQLLPAHQPDIAVGGRQMDERSTKVGELLHEAAETHHQVFRITDGADDDWASWYAQWLVTLSELPEVLGGTVVRSELTYLLVRLDKEFTERRVDQPWEDYYAHELVRHFSPD